jgi:hypothetical protein
VIALRPEAAALTLAIPLALFPRGGRERLLPAWETSDPNGESLPQSDDVRVLGLDAGAAFAAACAQREERENSTVIECLYPLRIHLKLPLPGLLVPLLDPGAQGVPATDDGWDARDLHTGVELVLRVNELRQESVDLATIEDLVSSPHCLEVARRHCAIISQDASPIGCERAKRLRLWLGGA